MIPVTATSDIALSTLNGPTEYGGVIMCSRKMKSITACAAPAHTRIAHAA